MPSARRTWLDKLAGALWTSEVKLRVVNAPGAMPGIAVKLANGEGVGGVAASSAESVEHLGRDAQNAMTMMDCRALAATPA